MNKNCKRLLEYVVDGDRVILGPGRSYKIDKFGRYSLAAEMSGLFIAALFASGFISEDPSITVIGIFVGCVVYMLGNKRRRIYKTIRDGRAAKESGKTGKLLAKKTAV